MTPTKQLDESFAEWSTRTGLANRECKVCALPVEWQDQIDQALGLGYRATSISKYLREKGLDVSQPSLSNCLTRGHDRRRAK